MSGWKGVKKTSILYNRQKTQGEEAGGYLGEDETAGEALAIVGRSFDNEPPPGRPKYLRFLLPESGGEARVQLLWSQVVS